MGLSEKDENTDINGPPCGPYCSHVVSMKKRRVYSTLNWVFLSLVSPLCQQDIGFGESEINELHSVLFIYEECTRRNKNKMSCQGCRVTTSDLKIFQSDDMTITLIIISNKINYVFFPFFVHPSHSYCTEGRHYLLSPNSVVLYERGITQLIILSIKILRNCSTTH